MAITQLKLYNIALLALGERSLDSLSEDRDSRRHLDEVWAAGNGARDYFLEQGLWTFATRAAQVDRDTSVTPSFGLTYAFQRPTDIVRLISIASDENFNAPLRRFETEAGYIYADINPIYIRYVSNDTSYGYDYSLWPDSFSQWAGHWLALQVAPRVKHDLDMERLERRTDKLLHDAKSKDAQNQPNRYKPLGSWANARFGGRWNGKDRGPRNTLIS